MCREDPQYAEMIMYHLVECRIDRFEALSDDDFLEMIQSQYDNAMKGDID